MCNLEDMIKGGTPVPRISDQTIFEKLAEQSQRTYQLISPYFKDDTKPFVNKITRDYQERGDGQFPVYLLGAIKSIPRTEYDSAVVLCRGGLPYGKLFEAAGWKVHYVRAGRKYKTDDWQHETEWNPQNLVYDDHLDPSMKEIQGKRVLVVDNNVLSGITPLRAAQELRSRYDVSPDLFIDYFVEGTTPQTKSTLGNTFGTIYTAREMRFNPSNNAALKREFYEGLNNV